MKALKNSLIKNFKSYGFAINGIRHVIGHENNIKYQTLAAITIIIIGLYLDLTLMKWVVITLCIGLVLMAELFNSAIEKIVNLINPKYSKEAGLIKDIAAGAVLIIATSTLIVAVLILFF